MVFVFNMGERCFQLVFSAKSREKCTVTNKLGQALLLQARVCLQFWLLRRKQTTGWPGEVSIGGVLTANRGPSHHWRQFRLFGKGFHRCTTPRTHSTVSNKPFSTGRKQAGTGVVAKQWWAGAAVADLLARLKRSSNNSLRIHEKNKV